jgi:hypothetical protein
VALVFATSQPYNQTCILTTCVGRRKALESQAHPKHLNRKWVVYTEESNVPKTTSPTPKSNKSNQITTISPPSQNNSFFCAFDPAQRDAYLNELHARALYAINNPPLTTHPSFSLTQLNIISAMCTNADLMGLTLELLNEDLASQFNLLGPSSLHLPPSLWPSKSQRKIIHHPWIDLLPMVSLREALLFRAQTLDEDELCGDLCGVVESDEIGLRVWGEAWDPFAYEASERLIRKWDWLVVECPDIIRSTNSWRRRRGEKAIVFKNTLNV